MDKSLGQGFTSIETLKINTYVKTALQIGYLVLALLPALIIVPTEFAARHFNKKTKESDLYMFAEQRAAYRAEDHTTLVEKYDTEFADLSDLQIICLCEVLLEKSLKLKGTIKKFNDYNKLARYCTRLDQYKIKLEVIKNRCDRNFADRLARNANIQVSPTEIIRWDTLYHSKHEYYTSLKKDIEGRLALRESGPQLSDTQRYFMAHIKLYCDSCLAELQRQADTSSYS